MFFSLLLLLTYLNGWSVASSPALPVGVRCEYRENPLGIDTQQPHLSWQMQDSRRGARQQAYQVLVSSSEERLRKDQGDLWNSGKVDSDQSAHILYSGPTLQSRGRYYWKVKLWDQNGKESAWSQPARWEMGLLNPSDWQADWIGKDLNPPADKLPAGNWVWHPQTMEVWKVVYLRKNFQIPAGKNVKAAVIQITADDTYEVKVNNKTIGYVRNFEPIRELKFRAYTIGDALQAGENTVLLAAVLTGKRTNGRGGAVAAVKITLTDGTVLSFVTDATWQAAASDKPGWSAEPPEGAKWQAAQVIEPENGPLFGKVGPAYVSPGAILVRKEFTVSRKMRQARAYVTGLGGYYLYLNGKRASHDLMAPGWTNYHKRIQYQTYDVTHLLRTGNNAVAAELGNLWWSGEMNARGIAHFNDGPLRFLMQLHLQYDDGTEEIILTDPTWKAHPSPITFNSIYDGERHDARLEVPGWHQAGLNEAAWQPVELIREKKDILVAEQVQPIRATQEMVPVSVKKIGAGRYIFDLGQNIAGWARLKVQGPAGTKITLRFAEILNEDGSLKTEPLRTAKATDEYILRGGGPEEWEPSFTYHGFQFVEVTGFPGTPGKDAITGVVLHTGAPVRGRFTSSNQLLNQIQHNIAWSLRGNIHSVVTDCPQRDERLGWTGDAQIFAMTASYNRDMTLLFRKYMRDVTDGQVPNGNVSNFNPNPFEEGAAQAGWADALVIVPWRVYQFTGDKRILAENYPAMVRWHDQKVRESKDYLREDGTFGDWVSVEKTPEKPISAFYHYYSTKLLARIAQELGKEQEAQKYEQLTSKIAQAVNAKYFDQNTSSYEGGTQAANLLPLAFGLPAPADASKVARNVADNVKERKVHLTTGFLGTQFILPMLSDYGYHDLAYQLATQRTYPSWGYMIDRGATTMWELWNSDQQGPDMNSRNHYAYGTVGEWFFGYLAGIRPDEAAPGFKKTIIAPRPAGNLQWAEGNLETLYGTVMSRWERKGSSMVFSVTVPANSVAEVRIPVMGRSNYSISEGGNTLVKAGKQAGKIPAVEVVTAGQNEAILNVGAGNYHFTLL